MKYYLTLLLVIFTPGLTPAIGTAQERVPSTTELRVPSTTELRVPSTTELRVPSTTESPSSATPKDGFTTLFDGKSLEHWTMGPDQSWVVTRGEIHLKREFDGKEHNLDYLWTKEQYGDFVLELEFKVPERANSGVFIRTPDRKDPVFTGMEIQVTNSHGRKTWTKGNCAGAVYDLLAPSANVIYEPGKWNRFRITCLGPRIQIALNEKSIIDMDVNKWHEPNKNPDGTKNKFGTAIKDFARKGYIGLQDHGRQVAYRNIRVKRL